MLRFCDLQLPDGCKTSIGGGEIGATIVAKLKAALDSVK